MDPTPHDTSAFAPTRWTQVLQARGNTPEAKAALGALCESYWQPVFRFLRRSGRDEDTARELTQEFCARLLAGDPLAAVDPRRGRFRSFLLGALKHFLADLRAHQGRQKRGGGIPHEPLSSSTGTDTTVTLEVADSLTMPADEIYDRQWALAVIDHALKAVERELAEAGKSEHFDLLKPWNADRADAAASKGEKVLLVRNETTLKIFAA